MPEKTFGEEGKIPLFVAHKVEALFVMEEELFGYEMKISLLQRQAICHWPV